MNDKGQADTVFEVLIAVILLSFVLVVGSYAMSSLSETKCSKEIDISLSEFTRAIERVAKTPLGSEKYFLNIPRCFGTNATLSIEKQSGGICRAYCAGTSAECIILTYNNPDDPTSSTRFRCVNVSSQTNFNESECSNTANIFSTGSSENDFSATKSENRKLIIRVPTISSPSICIEKQVK